MADGDAAPPAAAPKAKAKPAAAKAKAGLAATVFKADELMLLKSRRQLQSWLHALDQFLDFGSFNNAVPSEILRRVDARKGERRVEVTFEAERFYFIADAAGRALRWDSPVHDETHTALVMVGDRGPTNLTAWSLLMAQDVDGLYLSDVVHMLTNKEKLAFGRRPKALLARLKVAARLELCVLLSLPFGVHVARRRRCHAYKTIWICQAVVSQRCDVYSMLLFRLCTRGLPADRP